MEIGTRLKNARVEMGLTQEKVAEEIGVSRQTVSNWENGKCYPDIVNVIKLSDLYSVSLDELLKEDKNMVRHLKESTDVVTSRKKLTKLIITLVYWGFWVLAISVYWIFWLARDFAPVPLLGFVKDMDVRFIHYLYVIPFTAVIAAFMGVYESFGRLRWVYIPISGVVFMLFQILTVQLLWEISILTYLKVPFKPFNIFKWYFADPGLFLSSLASGLVSSAIGVWIGAFIRHAVYYVKSQKEKETQ